MINPIPTTGLRQYITELAAKHNVVYIETHGDVLAAKISELSDKGVQTDDIEKLCIALARADVISNREMIALQINYLRETLPPADPAADDDDSGYRCVPLEEYPARPFLYMQMYLPSAARILFRSEVFLSFVKGRSNVDVEFTESSFAAMSADPQIVAALERLKESGVQIDVLPSDHTEYPLESVHYYRIVDRDFIAKNEFGENAYRSRYIAAEDIIAGPAGVLR